jgi:thiol-disulfide isomerase/thioredoxin
MKNNTRQHRWIKCGALALLCGGAILSAAQLSMPTVEAQTSGARSAPLAPELLGKNWLNTPNSKPMTLDSRRGEVTIVQFWTFGCSNCRANLPSYELLQKQFGPRGVEIIGVHTPEFDHERSPRT